PSFNIDRLREAPIGYFFDVQTQGFGAMMDYSAQIPPSDRWAIAAYVRALQLSQRTTIADVPAADRGALEASGAEARPPAFPIDPDDCRGALDEGPTERPEKEKP